MLLCIWNRRGYRSHASERRRTMPMAAIVLIVTVVLALGVINIISSKASSVGKKSGAMEYVIILAVMATIALAVYVAGQAVLGHSVLEFINGASSNALNFNGR